MQSKNSYKVAFFFLFLNSILYSQVILNEGFIRGNSVEVGVNSSGAYGTDGPAPVLYHPRVTLGGSDRNLGFVADPNQDGWNVGTPDYFGDFFYPGQRQEGFSVQFNNAVYHNWTSMFTGDIPGNNISLTTEGTNNVELWQGSINGLSIKQKTIVPQDNVYFVIRVELKNTTTTPMTGVYYMRTLDPDNDQTLSGNYTTTNNIAFKLPNTNNNTLVSAKGTVYTNCYLGLGTRDCRAKPFIVISGLLNPTPSDLIEVIYNETDVTDYQYTGQTIADAGIGISFFVGNIAPGETKSFAMAYILNQSDLEIALAQTSPELQIDTQTLVNNSTYTFCQGEAINMNVLNGEDNIWHWEPEAFFSNPYGENVSLTVPNVTTTFTVTGESDCAPVSYTFTVNPAVYESPLTQINHVLCSGTSTSYNPLSGIVTPTSTIGWYDAPVGGTLLSSSPLFTTPVLTNSTSAPVVYSYYYEETNTSSCLSQRVEFNVTVYNALDLPDEELKICTVGTTGTFNLTDIQTISNATYSYYLSMADLTANIPITNTTSFNNTTNNQVIYVKIVINSSCSDVITLTLKIFNQLNVQPAILNGCDDDFDDTIIFNLTDANSDLYLGTDSQFSYFLTQSNAENNVNEITDFAAYSNISNPQTIYVRVYNTNCSQVTSLSLNVFDKPIVVNGALESCETNLDGTADFNLTLANTQFNSSDLTLTYTFYTSAANLTNNIPVADATDFTNTSNPQTIYVKATSTSGCFSTSQLELIVNPTTRLAITDLSECDDDYDGFALFNLNDKTPEILAAIPPDTYSYSYYLSEANALSSTNAITPSFTNTSSPQTIYVRAQSLNGCPYIINFDLIVLVKPQLNIDLNRKICDGGLITLNVPTGFDNYLWSTGATTNSIAVSTPGNYTVTVSNDYGTLSCATSATIQVVSSNIATITNIDIQDWTDTENSISVSVQGLGDYEYSIDGMTYQDSPVFEGLESGVYTVYVRDKNECGIADQQIYILMYPKFFTPNGDGVHDIWNVRYSSFEPNLTVAIFDRFGKLIKGFNGGQIGWDGTYNGQILPATDYWFVVTRADGTTYRGHFAMKR